MLPGVTRRSCIELLKDWGYEVVEGKIAIADIMAAAREGKLEEVFGTGTAAVVSPVKELVWKGEHAFIGDGKEEAIDLTENDLVFITNGGCVENSSMGSQNEPAQYNTELKECRSCRASPSAAMWSLAAAASS